MYMPNINLPLSEELLSRVDEAAGDVPRVRWIRTMLERCAQSEIDLRSVVEAQALAGVLRPGVGQRPVGRTHLPSCKCPVCS